MISENFVELLPQNNACEEQGGCGRAPRSWGDELSVGADIPET